jgi:LPXTG-motif cell wall-anchored protein
VEVVVPDGYNKMQDLTFTVSAEHDVESDDPALKSLSGGTIGDGVIATGLLTEEVINQTGTILPETGAMGTLWLIVIGSMLVVLAGVFMITRKKMSVFED